MTTFASTLSPRAFTPLSLGAISPLGWLHDQLRIQADGLSGHLDEFWPSVADSRWIGGTQEGWERGPYWLDGLVPLAVLLDDPPLRRKAQRWINYILDHQHTDGWLGPKDDPHSGTGENTLDPWPLFILFKVFTQWHEATGDTRIIPAMLQTCHRIDVLLSEKPLRSWARMRWADLVLSLHWLYEKTGETWLLELAATAHNQGYDWQGNFAHFPFKMRTDPTWLSTLSEEDCLPIHGVNNAMGIKTGAVWGRQSHNPSDAQSSLEAIATLDQYHGQVMGMFSGDEHLAGRDPSQGTETCTVTEYLFTLEQMMAIIGEAALGDRIERIAYNALPAALTKDMWARQYDQQPNQVLCSVARRAWVSNGPQSNLFSVEGNFGCCTANFHQGWPKLVSHLWMRSADEGLAAVAYGPCSVTVQIGTADVTIEEITEYPFKEDITLAVHTTALTAFPLHLRIPEWAAGATVRVNNDEAQIAKAGTFQIVTRTWQSGDTVTLHFPMELRLETRPPHAVSVIRGPLVMAFKPSEEFRRIDGEIPHADWEVHPTTSWNYALQIGNLTPSTTVQEDVISAQPFDPKASPVVVSVQAQRVPEWGLINDSAASPPRDVRSGQPSETVQLIPYGSTNLRISEFPITNATARAT